MFNVHNFPVAVLKYDNKIIGPSTSKNLKRRDMIYMSKLVYSEKFGCYGVFRAWRIDPRTQQKIYAKTYGKRAWFIPVNELEPESDE